MRKSDLEKKVFTVASNIFERSKKEYEKIKSFLNSGFINDYEFECEIVFFKDTEDIISYSTPMCWYFDESRRFEEKLDFDEFYESLLIWVKAELGIEYRSNIPNLEYAIYRLKSYYQLVYEDFKNLKDLETYLPFLEAKVLILRNKLTKSLLKKRLNNEKEFMSFNLYLEVCAISENGEEEFSLYPLDLKFLRGIYLDFLRGNSKKLKHLIYKYIRSRRSKLVNNLHNLIKNCKRERQSNIKIEITICSLILEQEYFIYL